ncbi:MAG: pilus assembly protein PilP [Deltaproteobacteria bacterium]|nr:pilus assembly protein PilP [Deltaproteobacteria bacterium]
MLNKKQQTRNPRSKKKYAPVIVMALIIVPFNLAIASQDLIYKDTKKGVGDLTGEYFYDPTDKPDPFKSFLVLKKAISDEDGTPKTYLETLELSQIDVSIIVVGADKRWAVVVDSKNVGHVIREGTPIGTNGGTVNKIGEGEIVIREEYKDFRGRTQYRDIVKRSSN